MEGGAGPDNPKNSYYSWHYYNPLISKGDGPRIVQRYYELLLTNMLDPQEKTLDPLSQKETSSPRNAAYVAHYIQDMGCPFHVFGMPRKGGDKIAPKSPPGEKVSGPYRQFDQELWAKAVREAEKNTDPHTDWFDANYYDGEVYPVMGSTHFSYEGFVEVAYKKGGPFFKALNFGRFMGEEGLVSPHWSGPDQVKQMAQAMAKETRDRVDQRKGDLWFDGDIYQANLSLGAASLYRLSYDELFQAVDQFITVPYKDWWRCIQATYSIWRGSFSALILQKRYLKFSEAFGKPNMYHLMVRVNNMEPKGDVVDVRVSFSIKGRKGYQGGGRLIQIKTNALSEWVELDGDLALKDLDFSSGEVVLEITGDYGKIPDSGITRVTFPLQDIDIDDLKMPDLVGSEGNWAKKFMEANPFVAVVTMYSAGFPKTKNQAKKVVDQTPQAGTAMSPHEKIIFVVYNDYLITVPTVIGLTLTKAQGILADAGLSTQPGTILVEDNEEEGVVKDQSPQPGAKVPVGEEVTILVSRRKLARKEGLQQKQEVSAPSQEETFSEESTGVLLSEMLISPSSGRIRIKEAISLTAIPFDIDGKVVSAQELQNMHFQWMVNDPAMAYISFEGNKATLTPRKQGVVQAIAICEQAMGYATITVADEEGEVLNDDGQGHEGFSFLGKPPDDREDLSDTEPVFDESHEGAVDLDEYCDQLYAYFMAAMRNHDFEAATAALQEASICFFYDEGYQLLTTEESRYHQEVFEQHDQDFENMQRQWAQEREEWNSRWREMFEARRNELEYDDARARDFGRQYQEQVEEPTSQLRDMFDHPAPARTLEDYDSYREAQLSQPRWKSELQSQQKSSSTDRQQKTSYPNYEGCLNGYKNVGNRCWTVRSIVWDPQKGEWTDVRNRHSVPLKPASCPCQGSDQIKYWNRCENQWVCYQINRAPGASIRTP